MSAETLRERVAEALSAHDEVSFDLGTPRQYTARGGWNVNCACGESIGESGDTDLDLRHDAHLLTVLTLTVAALRGEQP